MFFINYFPDTCDLGRREQVKEVFFFTVRVLFTEVMEVLICLYLRFKGVCQNLSVAEPRELSILCFPNGGCLFSKKKKKIPVFVFVYSLNKCGQNSPFRSL